MDKATTTTTSYDLARGQPSIITDTRRTARKGTVRNDTFGYNARNELTEATLGSDPYAYDYDNIGNRKTAQENAEELTYTANDLNQYTQITDNDGSEFIPEYDADGNQTRIRTSTGIWSAEYNAQNRAIRYTRENSDGTITVITADYDSMGRRAWKKVETITPNPETGEETTTVTLHHRYIYRGYLQIATCDLTRSAHPCLWLITWNPTQPIATRPLAIQKDRTWYCYGWDLTKNISDRFWRRKFFPVKSLSLKKNTLTSQVKQLSFQAEMRLFSAHQPFAEASPERCSSCLYSQLNVSVCSYFTVRSLH